MNRPLRVLLVAEHASAKFGGEAVLTLHYYRVLRSRGIPVWLVVHERTRDELMAMFPNDGDRIFFAKDTAWHRILWRIGKQLPVRFASFSVGFVMRLLTQLEQRRIIRRIVQDEGITVIHQPMPVSPKEPSLIYGFDAPVIIGSMNGGMNYPPAFRSMQSRFEFASIWLGRKFANAMNWLIPGKRRAALLLVANERTKNSLPTCVLNNRIEMLVENGVDLSLWKVRPARNQQSNDTVHFVFVGRLISLKAVDLLLEAFRRVSMAQSMSLSIIGDGVERNALEKLANGLGVLGQERVAGKVNFVGWLSQVDCVAKLQDADALILPSLMECGGAVVLEAMAMAMPVIATNWGGPADYLDSTCGILIEPTSVDTFVAQLSEAILTLATSTNLREQMGNSGRKKVQKYFDWEVKVDEMIKIYQSTIISR